MLPRQLRAHRRRPAARPAGRRHRARARRRLRLAAAGVAAGRAHGLDGRTRPGSWPPSRCRLHPSRRYARLRNGYGLWRNRAGATAHHVTNPFVYGEIVPAAAFVDREVELDRLGRDLYAGPEGLPHLAAPLRQVVARPPGAEERGPERRPDGRGDRSAATARTSAFLEGYARALASAETRLDRARSWLSEMLAGVRPEVRIEPDEAGRSQISRVLSRGADRSRRVAPRAPGLCPPGTDRRSQAPPDGDRARRVPGHRGVQRRERRARAPRRGAAAAPGRLRLLGVRADADGADARQEPAVLQGRPGDAPAEDPGRSIRGLHRSAVQGHGLQARGRARRGDRRSRRQPALRRAASRARGVGRRARRGRSGRRTSKTCTAR